VTYEKKIRMATSVTIVQNNLADRDPQLAILYLLAMVSLIFSGEGRFRSMRNCFRSAANDGGPKRIASIL
jgi:hypothetical protein